MIYYKKTLFGRGPKLTAVQILNHKKKGVTAKYIQNTHQRLRSILEDVQNNLFDDEKSG
jgi:arginyl-tRNA synthetase